MQTFEDDDDEDDNEALPGLDKLVLTASPPVAPPNARPAVAEDAPTLPDGNSPAPDPQQAGAKQKKLPTKVNRYGAISRPPSKLTLNGCFGPDGALQWPDLNPGWGGGLNQ